MIDAISSIEEIPSIDSNNWIHDGETSKYLVIDYKFCQLHIYIGEAFGDFFSIPSHNLKSFKDFDFISVFFKLDDEWFAPHEILSLKNFSWAESRTTDQIKSKNLDRIMKDLFKISKLAVFM